MSKNFSKIRNKFDKAFIEDGFCWNDFNESLNEAYNKALEDVENILEKYDPTEQEFFCKFKKLRK